jgi:ribosomal protein S1
VTEHTLKPGYLVSAKVSKILENGLELSFLGGLTGTIFADHLSKPLNKFKVGEKIQPRVISQDVASKTTALTLLPSLLSLTETQDPVSVGTTFKKVKVERRLFGGSYLIKLGDKESEGK